MSTAFLAAIMERHRVRYDSCPACGFLCTEEPWWLEEAYRSPITRGDTGILRRNTQLAQQIAAFIAMCADPRGSYIDLAGGYGLLVRHLRDMGIDAWWDDPHATNLFARGFERNRGPSTFTGVTAIEVLEHLHAPLPFLRQAVEICSGPPLVIMTTRLFHGKPPDPERWSYYARHEGQHIAFYQRRTLDALAAKLGLVCRSCNGLHVFADPGHGLGLMPLATSRLAYLIALAQRWRLGSRTEADSRAVEAGA